MRPSLLILPAIAALLATSCQSDTYKIEGHGDNLTDGDTIYLSALPGEGAPIASAVVSKGKFVIEGTTEDVTFCRLHSKGNPAIGATLFLEPGTITVDIAPYSSSTSRVSGTPTNRKWQQLCDSLTYIGAELSQTAEFLQKNARTISADEQRDATQRIDKLQQKFMAIVTAAATENTDNEFGYFVLTRFDGAIEAAKRLDLLRQMPAEMQQRPEAAQLISELEQKAKTAEGSPLPHFTMNDTEGNPLNLYDEISRHRLTLIDFWASWCGPCRQEMPSVVALYEECAPRGLGIIGVSLDQNEEAWKRAIDDLGIRWTQVSDLKGWHNEMAQAMGVNAIPHTVVVDSTGTILSRGLRGDQLAQFIRAKLDADD